MFNMAMVAKQEVGISLQSQTHWRLEFSRLGNGSKIKVMNEPWLWIEDGRWVEAPQNQEEVVNNILVVPLLDVIEDDKLIWSEERDGMYSVRSGYKKLMKEKASRQQPRGEKAWGRLWKIQAPPKAKHLLWRICKECLPTRVRLRDRYVQCPIEVFALSIVIVYGL
ncbi:polynucleotidyl transferase ribonuclease H fold [Trifolium medium]|uniref:Polynucleotidyl transferase ribonuclease H fold n=1 Tax=Trifolium medium TaxID=97028 RepID=A0A392MAB5_9FABA|nr:polynucleotidyl transferase ribonuclease H fold [Trifolium medium]